MKLSKVPVILCQLVRKILFWRVLELKQKAFLEAVKSVQPWIWMGRVEGHSCEFFFTLRCMITLHWYLGHYTCCSATSVNVRKSSKLSSRSSCWCQTVM